MKKSQLLRSDALWPSYSWTTAEFFGAPCDPQPRDNYALFRALMACGLDSGAAWKLSKGN